MLPASRSTPAHDSALATPRRVVARLREIGASVLVGATLAGLTLVAGVGLAPAAQAEDSSAVTVAARTADPDAANAPFPDLELTVAQTRGLVSQAVQVSWKGGRQSTLPGSGNGGRDFLQLAQCWGTVTDEAGVPGPDRTTCQYGAFLGYGATRDSYRTSGTTAPEDAEYSVPSVHFSEADYTSIPFRSTSGRPEDVIRNVVDNARIPGIDVNTNRFFTKYTSNEISFAGFGADGTGSAKFEMQTATQAPALGCGAPVKAADGTITGAGCWLVAIPRGAADPGEQAITQSGLFWDAWKHRLAVRLDFRPTTVGCAIGAEELQLAGSEMLAGAVSSWQPALCGAEGGDSFVILTGSEADAARSANGTVPGPMALTSLPLTGDVQDELAYAPVGLTGVAVTFAIDRQPRADSSVPAEAAARSGVPLSAMNLTPRLVAKLLTSSYLDSLPADADRSHLAGRMPGGQKKANPRNLLFDPDFLAVNDAEWGYQAIVGASIADALVPQGRSDAASALWSYVMADPDARAFLAGEPDPWGMGVNPWSSTAQLPKGGSQTYPTDSFPKSDPAEAPAPIQGAAPVNLVTWRPYVNDLDSAAYLTLRGDGQTMGAWNPNASPQRYDRDARSLPGVQKVIGVTDTSAAAKYQTITAALQNPSGAFVQPTTGSLTAAAAAMTASPSQGQVYGLDLAGSTAKAAPTAYPLALPVYAAVNPQMTDAALRASYAQFIRYAASDTAQTPGVDVGRLPAGYAPLPAGWREQARTAADLIQSGRAPETAPPAASATIPSAPSSYAGGSLDAVPVADAQPAASGAAAGALAGATTPDDPKLEGLQNTIPLSLLAGLLGSAAVPLISRLRRRL